MQKKVVVTGATGFIGSRLCAVLKDKGYEVIAVTMKKTGSCSIFEQKYFCTEWNVADTFIDSAYAVINLAGESIGSGPWTQAKKERILRSRMEASELVVESVEKAAVKPSVLVQASASGYYGADAEGTLDENAPAGDGFLSEVCRKWEEETAEVEQHKVRRVMTRFAPVLGRGGLLAAAEKPFRFFLGGPMGLKNRPFPWVHIDDAVSAIIHLMENSKASGPYNICAPAADTNRKFASALGRALKKPSWLPVPEAVLSLLPGGMGRELFMGSFQPSCEKLLKAGFKFRYTDIDRAMEDIYK